MKTKTIFALLILALTACAPAVTPAVTNMDIQNTAIAAAWTSVALTPIAPPTAMSVPPTVTLTATVVVYQFTPTRVPQIFVPMMTPDTFQVEHWKEYQDALARRFIFSSYVPFALCEWDILGRTNQEVYVWAVCAAPAYQDMRYAVIHLEANGTVQTIETPYNGDGWASDVQRMFPPDVREMIDSYDANNRTIVMLNHIDWRRTHPDEPPLIVLSVTPVASPTP